MPEAYTTGDLFSIRISILRRKLDIANTPRAVTAEKDGKVYRAGTTQDGSATFRITEKRPSGWTRIIWLEEGPADLETQQHWYGRVYTKNARGWEKNIHFMPTNKQIRSYIKLLESLEWRVE